MYAMSELHVTLGSSSCGKLLTELVHARLSSEIRVELKMATNLFFVSLALDLSIKKGKLYQIDCLLYYITSDFNNH